MTKKTFTIEQAVLLVEHYNYLIGRNFNLKTEDCKVLYLAVTPVDFKQFEKWMNRYYVDRDYKQALLFSGYDPKNVVVRLFTSYSSTTLYTDLDTYLTEYKEEKLYLSDGF